MPDDGGARDATSEEVYVDAHVDVADLDVVRDDAVADGSTFDAHDALNCSGPATFDLPSQQAAEQICHPPSCKVCVQEVDAQAMPTKWSAWQIPSQCPCPPPAMSGADAGADH